MSIYVILKIQITKYLYNYINIHSMKLQIISKFPPFPSKYSPLPNLGLTTCQTILIGINSSIMLYGSATPNQQEYI